MDTTRRMGKKSTTLLYDLQYFPFDWWIVCFILPDIYYFTGLEQSHADLNTL